MEHSNEYNINTPESLKTEAKEKAFQENVKELHDGIKKYRASLFTADDLFRVHDMPVVSKCGYKYTSEDWRFLVDLEQNLRMRQHQQ